MSHVPAESHTPDAGNLPGDLVALLDERAEREGLTRHEALVRCLHEWRAHREARRPQTGPLPTTDRELYPAVPAASDRTGTDSRD